MAPLSKVRGFSGVAGALDGGDAGVLQRGRRGGDGVDGVRGFEDSLLLLAKRRVRRQAERAIEGT